MERKEERIKQKSQSKDERKKQGKEKRARGEKKKRSNRTEKKLFFILTSITLLKYFTLEPDRVKNKEKCGGKLMVFS